MNDSSAAKARAAAGVERIVRHAAVDRIVHWLIAACVLVLLTTAFLPILGVEFAWVDIHWITGLIMTAAVIVHILRSLTAKDLRAIWFGRADARDIVAELRWNLRASATPPPKPGKYSVAQKLIHHGFAVVVITTVVTGSLMLMKIDTPWWRRDPYLLSDRMWGFVYVLHDLSALLLITMIISHIYFALRPEKLHYLRSMVAGWITRREFETNHDINRWQI